MYLVVEVLVKGPYFEVQLYTPYTPYTYTPYVYNLLYEVPPIESLLCCSLLLFVALRCSSLLVQVQSVPRNPRGATDGG